MRVPRRQVSLESTHPFAELEYLRTLGLGRPRESAMPVPLLVRRIPGSHREDGILGWPYVGNPPGDLIALSRRNPDLVSVVGVLSPALDLDDVAVLSAAGLDVIPLKEHFVSDPALPPREWSMSTRTKIRRALQAWQLRDLGPDDLPMLVEVYGEVVARRRLVGTFWDFGPSHFRQLLASSRFRVRGMVDEEGALGCFVCLGVDGRDVHAVHMGGTEPANRSGAPYGLMSELVASCRAAQERLFLGGIPAGNPDGSESFKARWSNDTRTAHLLRLVVDAGAYAELAPGGVSGYFPRYRRPWS
jgi:hypothetical protein